MSDRSIADPGDIAVEVVFALAERQELVAVKVSAGTTAGEAVKQSGVAKIFPEQDLSECQLGIWGQPVEHDRQLKDGDRIEIYRCLLIDPREARRQLAAKGRFMGHADNDAE
ncbi:MAG: RnfH family protein [Gammaproteobacteria bacterium]|nr:RnfH family protein [Gammaproteobacteria bacterium]